MVKPAVLQKEVFPVLLSAVRGQEFTGFAGAVRQN
jgi:hypothetical protein